MALHMGMNRACNYLFPCSLGLYLVREEDLILKGSARYLDYFELVCYFILFCHFGNLRFVSSLVLIWPIGEVCEHLSFDFVITEVLVCLCGRLNIVTSLFSKTNLVILKTERKREKKILQGMQRFHYFS